MLGQRICVVVERSHGGGEAPAPRVIGDAVRYWTDYVNPAFLEYRKSVSTDYTAVEWQDEGSVFHDIKGKEFLDMMVQREPRAKQVINDPPMLALVFLFVLGFLFTVVVGFCAAGGALGARFTSSKTSDTPSVTP